MKVDLVDGKTIILHKMSSLQTVV